MRAAIRARHDSRRTEDAYVRWIRRFILYHRKRHPLDMGETEVSDFLTSLAARRRVSASTQNQALSATLFPYKDVLDRPLEPLEGIVRAKPRRRMPVVPSRAEVKAVLAEFDGVAWSMASLFYGAGLRLLECAGLPVKDIDVARNEIAVRSGKGNKDRVTM